MSRRIRSRGTESHSQAFQEEADDSFNLEVSLRILKDVIQNKRVKFSKIANNEQFLPVLHFCSISVKRFCQNPLKEINYLLDSARKSGKSPFPEECFLIEIFTQFQVNVTEQLRESISEVYATFEDDLKIAQDKARNSHFLEGLTPKPKGSRQVDESLPDKQLFGIYNQDELEFWILVMEFNRYSVITGLIQELASNPELHFPTEFLLTQFSGSVDAMDEFKTYISNFFDEFFNDQRWLPFIEQTPELIDYIINVVFPNLQPSQVIKCSKLYIPFLRRFFDQIFLGNTEVDVFVQFVTITGDEKFVNVLDTRQDIAESFQEFFLTHFNELFSNEKWSEFLRGSRLVIKFIVMHMYSSIPKEKQRLILDFNEELLDNILLDENVEQTVKFIVDLPVDFMIYQFTEENSTAKQFRSLFIINFDEYIVKEELFKLIAGSEELLEIIIKKVIPMCTQTKQHKLCQELYETYLKGRLNNADRNLVPLAEFVAEVSKSIPAEWLSFNKLSPSIQLSLFNYVSTELKTNDLVNNKSIYTEFYIPFLQVPTLMKMLPENMKSPFYMLIIIPYITTNTLKITPLQTYELALILAEDPFADQERCEFLQFLVKNVDELLPVIMKDSRIMKYCWSCIIRSEKDLVSSMNRDFIFRFCVIYLQMELPVDPKLFKLASKNFHQDNYEKHVTHDQKAHIMTNLASTFTKAHESKLSDRLALRGYQEAVTELIKKLSVDSYFPQSVEFAMSRTCKGFMKVLMDIFSTEAGFKKLFNYTPSFLKFTEIGLELFPQAVKTTFFTHERFSELLALFNRCSFEISQNDFIREAFLTYFLSNENKLKQFLQTVNQPIHKAMFYSEFSDSQKNSILNAIFTEFFQPPQEFDQDADEDKLPIHTIWLTFVNVMGLPFIHLKCLKEIVERVIDEFQFPSQDEFDQMFPPSKISELQNALYRLARILGLQVIIDLKSAFSTLEVDPEKNCFDEVVEDILIRYIPETRKETPEELLQYEEEHPRYRAFVPGDNRILELIWGVLAFILIYYTAILGFQSENVAAEACSVIASILIAVLAFPLLYFSKLNESGFTSWFYTESVIFCAMLSFSYATYILNGQLINHIPYIFLNTAFGLLTVYDIINGIADEVVGWSPDDENEEEDMEELSKNGSKSKPGTKNGENGTESEKKKNEPKDPWSKAEENRKLVEENRRAKAKHQRRKDKQKREKEEKEERRRREEEEKKKKKEEGTKATNE